MTVERVQVVVKFFHVMLGGHADGFVEDTSSATVLNVGRVRRIVVGRIWTSFVGAVYEIRRLILMK